MCEPWSPVPDPMLAPGCSTSFALGSSALASAAVTSPGPATRRVTLLCPEPLRASACCVEDALIARGWRVRLEFGAGARRVLLRPARSGDRELKVLCTAEPLDPDVEAQLRLGVDPDGRGDFQIVVFDTPRAVIEAVERLGGATTRRRRLAPRRGRTYLQHATLVEEQVHIDRNRRWGVATAVAVAIAVVASIEARPRAEDPVTAPTVQRADEPDDDGTASRSPTMDEPVLAAVRTALPPEDDELDDELGDEEEIVISDEPARAMPRAEAPERRTAAPRENVAPLETDATPPTPPTDPIDTARRAAPANAVAATPSELSERRSVYTVDPFTSTNASDPTP